MHTESKCPWCDTRLYAFMDQQQKEAHFVEYHPGVMKRLGRMVEPREPRQRSASRPAASEQQAHREHLAPEPTFEEPRFRPSASPISRDATPPPSPASAGRPQPALTAPREVDPGYRSPRSLPSSMESQEDGVDGRSASPDWDARLGAPPSDYEPGKGMLCSRCFRKVTKLSRAEHGAPILGDQMAVSAAHSRRTMTCD
jgi:hypothetical protein